jgi:hypothetical protein
VKRILIPPPRRDAAPGKIKFTGTAGEFKKFLAEEVRKNGQG